MTLFNRALELEQSRVLDEASRLYLQVLTDEPESAPEAHVNLGTIAFNNNDLKAAEHHYRSAIKLRPDYAIALFDLAGVYDQTYRDDQAIELYTRAVKVCPDYADAHYNLALLFDKKRDGFRALAHWKRFVKFDKRDDYYTKHAQRLIEVLEKGLVISNPEPRRTARRAQLTVVGARIAPDFSPNPAA